jgi:glycosyltransferase 2 family protein
LSPLPWRRLLGVLLIVAAGAYLTHTILSNAQELRAFQWQARPLRLVLSLIAHVLVLSWGVWVWSQVLRCFPGARVPLPALQRIWFVSNLARYIPGKIFQFVAVAQLGRAGGLGVGVLLTSVVVHAGFSLLAAGVLASWTLGTLFLPAPVVPWAAGGMTAIALAAVHPAVLNGILGVLPKLLRRPVIPWTADWGRGVLLLGLCLVSWAAYGVAYHLLVSALTEVSWSLLPQMAGVNALSFVAGYLSLLPGGIGLREVAMTELLRSYLPGGVAAVLALTARLWTIAAELAGAALAVVLARRAGMAGADRPW